eukprot:1152884-Pelagomonas_calceolata.AAC.1
MKPPGKRQRRVTWRVKEEDQRTMIRLDYNEPENNEAYFSQESRPGGVQGSQGVGLQPETLADWLLMRHPERASKIETNTDNFGKPVRS